MGQGNGESRTVIAEVDRLRSGDFFGEAGLFDSSAEGHGRYLCSIVTTNFVELLEINLEDLKHRALEYTAADRAHVRRAGDNGGIRILNNVPGGKLGPGVKSGLPNCSSFPYVGDSSIGSEDVKVSSVAGMHAGEVLLLVLRKHADAKMKLLSDKNVLTGLAREHHWNAYKHGLLQDVMGDLTRRRAGVWEQQMPARPTRPGTQRGHSAGSPRRHCRETLHTWRLPEFR